MASSDPPPPAEPTGPIRPGGVPPPPPIAPAAAPGAPPPDPSAPAPAPSTPGLLTVGEQPWIADEPPVKEELLKALYPPFPPYDEPPRATVRDTIMAGRELRAKNKALRHDAPIAPMPRPAKPRWPKVTDIPMSQRAKHAHAACLRRHGAVLTDRLEYMAKPSRRTIIYLWRDHADTLPPETIARLRAMLDADEPFKPDKAYDYFVNLRKTRRASKKSKIHELEKDMQAVWENKRKIWSRNATVAFARGVQQRLRRPGRYALADGMLRLSNIILNELCGYMKMATPCRRTRNAKGRFMLEMADKVAVWIDGILAESDDRMLMMDYDEDADIDEPPVVYMPPQKPPEPPRPEPPPVPKAPEPIKVEEVKWVEAEAGAVPLGALAGGHTSSGDPVYVVRAEHEESLIPGNLVPAQGPAAHVAWGGGQKDVPKYQVLIGAAGKWQAASGRDLPAEALPAGHTGTGEVLYVGRANHAGGVIVGMVSKSLGSLFIAFQGQEVAIQDYEILMN